MSRYTKKDFELIRFPNGEFKITTSMNIASHFEMRWLEKDKFGNGEKTNSPSEELVALTQLDKLVGQFRDRSDLNEFDSDLRPILFIDYVPFRRQDKWKVLGETTFDKWDESLRMFDVREAIPHNSFEFAKSEENTELFIKYVPENTTHICFPDEGAGRRFIIHKFRDSLGVKTIDIKKTRDAKTGKLTFHFPQKHVDDQNYANDVITIVDDIISYGGTFKAVQEYFEACGAKEVHLIVNHSDGVVTKKTLDLFDSVQIINGGLESE